LLDSTRSLSFCATRCFFFIAGCVGTSFVSRREATRTRIATNRRSRSHRSRFRNFCAGWRAEAARELLKNYNALCHVVCDSLAANPAGRYFPDVPEQRAASAHLSERLALDALQETPKPRVSIERAISRTSLLDRFSLADERAEKRIAAEERN